MTGWIIYDRAQYDRNRWFADQLLEKCGEKADMRLIITEYLEYGPRNGRMGFRYAGAPAELPDFALCRSIYPLLSASLEEAGVRVFNSSTVCRICNDKRLTYAEAVKAGVKVMDTLFGDRRFTASDSYPDLEYPVILKSAAGHGGAEVFLIEDREQLYAHIRDLPSDDYLIQKVCRPVGKDIRVYVLGGKILAAVLRTSSSFKSNFSLGGTAELYQLSCPEITTVNRLLEHFPAKPDFVGIDLLPGEDGPVFNEIEDIVGTRMLYAAAGLDAARLYTDYIFGEMNLQTP